MSGFDKREESYEKKFAHDAELRFKVEARRDKMLAAWFGAKCKMSAEEIATYSSELVRADLKTPGDMDVQNERRGNCHILHRTCARGLKDSRRHGCATQNSRRPEGPRRAHERGGYPR